MEDAASWRRLLEEDAVASEALDNVFHPFMNISTTDEAREDAFHEKIIRVRSARESSANGVAALPSPTSLAESKTLISATPLLDSRRDYSPVSRRTTSRDIGDGLIVSCHHTRVT
jgi:hypothetical protein